MSNKYYVHQQFNVIFCNEPIETPVGRVCWPALVTAKPPPMFDGKSSGEPKFEVTLLIPKTGPKTESFLGTLKTQVDEMLALFNQKSAAKIGSMDLLKDGDTMDHEKYPHHAGNWVLVARNAKDVRVVDGSADPKDVDKALVVGGVKARALVSAKVSAKGVGFTLNLVQMIKDDGVRFGGGTRDLTKMLSACEDDDDADAGSLAEVAAPAEAPAGNGKRGVVSAKIAAAVNKL